jgi:hypothetical protein
VLALHLQYLLSNPSANLDMAVNSEAAHMVLHDPSGFSSIASQCVEATKRLQKGLPPFEGFVEDPFARGTRTTKVAAPVNFSYDLNE